MFKTVAGLGMTESLRLQWRGFQAEKGRRRIRRIVMKRIRKIVKVLMVGLASLILVVWAIPVEAVNGNHEGPSTIYFYAEIPQA